MVKESQSLTTVADRIRVGRNDDCGTRTPSQGESFQRIWDSVHRNDEEIVIYAWVHFMRMMLVN